MQEHDLDTKSKDKGLELPEPAKDIYDIGFDAHLVRSPSALDNSNAYVETNPSQAASSVQNYLDALEVEEYFQIVHTTTTFGSGFRATTQYNFKDELKKLPPTALVYLITGTGFSATARALPLYTMGSSTTFNFKQVHKYSTRRKYIEIETRSPTADTFTYDVYILKDKFARQY